MKITNEIKRSDVNSCRCPFYCNKMTVKSRFIIYLVYALFHYACIPVSVSYAQASPGPAPAATTQELLELPNSDTRISPPSAKKPVSSKPADSLKEENKLFKIEKNTVTLPSKNMTDNAVATSGVSEVKSPLPSVQASKPVPVATGLAATDVTASQPGAVSAISDKINAAFLNPDNATFTIMFNDEEMDIAQRIITAHDAYQPGAKETEVSNKEKGSLSDLFASLNLGENKNKENTDSQKKLYNIYLGSIIYHSPGKWAVSLNNLMITSENNKPGSLFYIRRISRQAIELIWKPEDFSAVAARFASLSDNEKTQKKKIRIDNKTSSLILVIKPNQTFVTQTVSFQEGKAELVIHEAVAETNKNNNLLEIKTKNNNLGKEKPHAAFGK